VRLAKMSKVTSRRLLVICGQQYAAVALLKPSIQPSLLVQSHLSGFMIASKDFCTVVAWGRGDFLTFFVGGAVSSPGQDGKYLDEDMEKGYTRGRRTRRRKAINRM